MRRVPTGLYSGGHFQGPFGSPHGTQTFLLRNLWQSLPCQTATHRSPACPFGRETRKIQFHLLSVNSFSSVVFVFILKYSTLAAIAGRSLHEAVNCCSTNERTLASGHISATSAIRDLPALPTSK